MTIAAVYNGTACYDCGARSGLEPWAAPWDSGALARYARCADRERCQARARKARDSKTRRQGRIALALAPSPGSEPGECRWCGAKLRTRQDGSPSKRSRCEPRYEARDCARAWRDSYTYDVRHAIRVRDFAAHGCVRCADCKIVCERKRDVEPRVSWQADHELALEDGGEHVLENLRARCTGCHQLKTARENIVRASARRGAALAAGGQLALLADTAGPV